MSVWASPLILFPPLVFSPTAKTTHQVNRRGVKLAGIVFFPSTKPLQGKKVVGENTNNWKGEIRLTCFFNPDTLLCVMVEKTHNHLLSYEQYLKDEEWHKAREIITKLLEITPDDHWLLVQLSSTYYEERDYVKAYEFITDAFVLNPDCPFVMWHLAGTFEMLNKTDEALVIWEEILKRGVKKIAFGECGEGMDRAKSLLADCKYRTGFAYLRQGDKKKALKYLKAYASDIAKSIETIYDKVKALDEIKNL